MKIEVETVAVQGRAANHPNMKVQGTELETICSDQHHVEVVHSITRDRPRREIRRPARYSDDEGLIAYTLSVTKEVPEGVDPSIYTEAISCPNSSNWILAMQEEVKSLQKNQIWKLCELPKGRRALTAKWIYKKRNVFLELKMQGGKCGKCAWLLVVAIRKNVLTMMRYFHLLLDILPL